MNIGVIICGGEGLRLRDISGGLPKCLVPFCGAPLLEWQLRQMSRSGIAKVVIFAGFGGEHIINYLESRYLCDQDVEVIVEDTPLGSGGCLLQNHGLAGTLVVAFGDIVFNMDLAPLCRFHHANDSSLTIVAHSNDHPDDSDVVVLADANRIGALLRKPHRTPVPPESLAVAGLFCVETHILRCCTPRFCDFVQDLVPYYIRNEKVFAFNTSEYVRDIGTVARYRAAVSDMQRIRLCA
jgi:mannose-1-phosphate guanylyltransferase/phosphomannomutase